MSFAQEMKDFIAGWTAVTEMGQKKRQLDLQKEEIENLKEYRDESLRLEQERFNLQRENAAAARANASRRLALAEGAQQGQNAESVYESLGWVENSDVGDGSGEDTLDTSVDAGMDTGTGEDPYAIPTEDTVPAYAGGGMVDAMGNATGFEEEEPVASALPATPAPATSTAPTSSPRPQPRPDQAAPTSAAPTSSPRPQPRPERASAATRFIVEGAQEAASVAMPLLVQDAKGGKAAVGPGSDRQDITTNTGGLSPREWEAAIKAIDPNGEIPSHLKGAAVLSSTYRYFVEKGQPEKAARIAKAIIIADKQMTQTLGALAMNAIQNGDQQAAAKLLGDAFNRFPSGHEIKVGTGPNGQLTYSVMDDGKEVDKGTLSTDQFWALAGQVRNGSLFIQEMGRFADTYGRKSQQQQTSFSSALGDVSTAYARTVAAQDAYNAATQGTDADPKAAEAARQQWAAAAEQLKAAETAAMRVGVSQWNKRGSRPEYEASLRRAIKAAKSDEALATAVPEAPPAEQSSEPGLLGRAWNTAKALVNPMSATVQPTGAIPTAPAQPAAPAQPPVTAPGNPPAAPAQQGGKPLGPDGLAKARAAIAAGKDPVALKRALEQAGYSTEGL